MRGQAPPAGCKILVIGYGNTLRSDDGAGFRAAEAIAALDPPGVIALAVHQLTPELAERLARAELAIFIDARIADRGQEIALSPLESASSSRRLGHISDPRSLLALAETLYGHLPSAWLITIPAVDLSLGESLSATAVRGIEAARERILQMIRAESSR